MKGLCGTVKEPKDDITQDWRRGKVAEMLAKGYIQSDIAKVLQVSEATISRDVEGLREEATKALDAYLDDLPLQHAKARQAVDMVLKKAFEIMEKDGLEVSETLDSIKVILAATATRLNFLTDATALSKSVKHTESLKKQIQQLQKKDKPAPTWNVVTEEDKKGNKHRTGRKLPKLKKEVKAPIV